MQIVSATKDSIVTLEASSGSRLLELTIRRKELLPICETWDALKKLLSELEPGDDPGLNRRREEALVATQAGQRYADRRQRDETPV